MTLYKLECITEDGDVESNGYYIYKSNAQLEKSKMDLYPMNIKYGIIQNIIKIETKD